MSFALKIALLVVVTIWAAFRAFLDILEAINVIADPHAALTKVSEALGWLYKTPWWVPGLLAALIIILLFASSQKVAPRDQTEEKKRQNRTDDDAETILAQAELEKQRRLQHKQNQPERLRPKLDYDAERKITALDDILKFLRVDLDIGNRAAGLQSGWWNAYLDPKNHPNFQNDLRDFHDEMNVALGKLEAMKGRHPDYPDLLDPIGIDAYQVMQGIGKYLTGYSHLKNYEIKSHDALRLFMESSEKAFEKSWISVRDMRDKAIAALSKLRVGLAK